MLKSVEIPKNSGGRQEKKTLPSVVLSLLPVGKSFSVCAFIQVINLFIVRTHVTEVRLLKTKAPHWFHAVYHSSSALKQRASGFHRTQTCVSTTNAAFSKCYGNPPFKNMQPTPANMAGIMATCGYNWASRAPGGWAPNLLAVNTRNHTGPTRHTTHTWLHWLWKCCFFPEKGAFYLINKNRQALGGSKWATLKALVLFQTGLWTHDNSKNCSGSRHIIKYKMFYEWKYLSCLFFTSEEYFDILEQTFIQLNIRRLRPLLRLWA